MHVEALKVSMVTVSPIPLVMSVARSAVPIEGRVMGRPFLVHLAKITVITVN